MEHNGSARARKGCDDSRTRTQFQRTSAKTKRACMSDRFCLLFRGSGLPRATALCFVSRSLLSFAVLVFTDLWCPSRFRADPRESRTSQLTSQHQRLDAPIANGDREGGFNHPRHTFLPAAVPAISLTLGLLSRHFAGAHPTSDPLNCRGLGHCNLTYFFPNFTKTKSTRLTRLALDLPGISITRASSPPTISDI